MPPIVAVLDEAGRFELTTEARGLIALAADAAAEVEDDLAQVAAAMALASDRDSPVTAPVLLAALLRDLSHLWAQRLHARSAVLHIGPAPQRIVTNGALLLRALGGRLGRAFERGAKRVQVDVVEDAGGLDVRVSARGGGANSGMNARASMQVSEALADLDPGASLDLGLTITKRACDVLGDGLTVVSDLALGSDCTIRIPAQFVERAGSDAGP